MPQTHVGISSDFVLRLEAFDQHGIHCGYATWSGEGYCWNVRTAGEHVYADTQEQAEAWLRSRGAKTIRERRQGD